MKAAVYVKYGSPEVLEVKQVEKPTPKKDEVLLKIKATAVNSGDWRLRKADPFAVRFFFGLNKPKINILGSVFSGEIESIGENVKRFKVGDTIFGHTNMNFGAYAEYISIPENSSIALRPTNMDHKQAATIPFGGVTALHFLKKASLKPGQKILIVGASGSVGSAAVQLAKSFGAHVTGVCSTSNIELVRSIGADEVIDYSKVDFTENGETYDVIFDTVNAISLSKSIKSIKENGMLILSAAGMNEMLYGIWISMTRKIKVITGVIKHSSDDITFLKDQIESSKLKAVIDRTFSLDQIAAAHSYAETGHKKGNVAIEV
jgi:NADPH:quinone reductase-like Zn-dependent oxidoreductase